MNKKDREVAEARKAVKLRNRARNNDVRKEMRDE